MWFWLALAVVGASIIYAYRTHQDERRCLLQVLREISADRGGAINPGSALYLPSLEFETDTAQWRIGGMATDGTPGSSAFTFMNVKLQQTGKFIDDWRQVPAIQQELSDAKRRGINISVESSIVRLHRDGIARSRSEIDELVEIAELIVTTCRRAH